MLLCATPTPLRPAAQSLFPHANATAHNISSTMTAKHLVHQCLRSLDQNKAAPQHSVPRQGTPRGISYRRKIQRKGAAKACIRPLLSHHYCTRVQVHTPPTRLVEQGNRAGRGEDSPQPQPTHPSQRPTFPFVPTFPCTVCRTVQALQQSPSFQPQRARARSTL